MAVGTEEVVNPEKWAIVVGSLETLTIDVFFVAVNVLSLTDDDWESGLKRYWKLYLLTMEFCFIFKW